MHSRPQTHGKFAAVVGTCCLTLRAAAVPPHFTSHIHLGFRDQGCRGDFIKKLKEYVSCEFNRSADCSSAVFFDILPERQEFRRVLLLSSCIVHAFRATAVPPHFTSSIHSRRQQIRRISLRTYRQGWTTIGDILCHSG